MLRSVELFSGAGGLALGIAEAGFHHEAVIEWDHDACATMRHNKQRGVDHVRDWPIVEQDVRRFNYVELDSGIELLAGGPPCQPFSLGGKHRAYNDTRDMFPEVVRATRELQPRAVLVENVKGLLRQSFAEYFEYILLQLSYPEITSKPDEDWVDHLARLEQHHTAGTSTGLAYRVVFRLLNAADFGVPQRRERVFIVGFRSDLGVDWSFPDSMHTHDALLQDQWVTGAYWERHCIPVQDRPDAPARLHDRIVRLRSRLLPLDTQPWATVRDAIADLPDPEIAKSDSTILNHRFNPGARTYHGHTGSPLDEPAKTLKAGDHGVPGGENIVVMPDGRVRYFTVRESARLQTFPDAYAFRGSWSESMRQLGNAVPVTLARIIAGSIAERLTRHDAGLAV